MPGSFRVRPECRSDERTARTAFRRSWRCWPTEISTGTRSKPVGGRVLTSPLRFRLALHAFPRRFRTERAAEIEATFHEAALAGELHPYGPHALADVVTAGWRERARSHPPFGVYVKYRMFGGRLEPRWHAWMLDDVCGLFSLRRVLWVAWPLAIALLVSSVHSSPADPSRDAMIVRAPRPVRVAPLRCRQPSLWWLGPQCWRLSVSSPVVASPTD